MRTMTDPQPPVPTHPFAGTCVTNDRARDQRYEEFGDVFGDVFGGDPNHAHLRTWTNDDGNGHMGYVCACDAYRT